MRLLYFLAKASSVFVLLAVVLAPPASGGKAVPDTTMAAGPTIPEFAVKLGTKMSRHRGRQVQTIKSVTVFGPGVVGARISVSCRSTVLGSTPKLDPKVCARKNAGSAGFRKRKIRRDRVTFSNVNWRVRAVGELEGGLHLSVQVTKPGRIGRYLAIQNTESYPDIQLAITESGCLRKAKRGLHKRITCPDVSAFRGHLSSGMILKSDEDLQEKDLMLHTALRVERDGVLRLTTRCGPGIFGRNERTELLTETSGNPGAFLELESSGNLVLKSVAGIKLWETGTSSSSPWVQLVVDGDRFNPAKGEWDGPGFELVEVGGKTLWSSPRRTRRSLSCPLG